MSDLCCVEDISTGIWLHDTVTGIIDLASSVQFSPTNYYFSGEIKQMLFESWHKNVIQ